VSAVISTGIGDICIAECKRPSGKLIIIVAVYISPNNNKRYNPIRTYMVAKMYEFLLKYLH